MSKKTREECMTPQQKAGIASFKAKYKCHPSCHSEMIEATGVARPGKTRADKANGSWKPKRRMKEGSK